VTANQSCAPEKASAPDVPPLERPEAAGLRLALAQCLIEDRKLESVIEKAAEIGFADFIPVTSARSPRPPREREDRRLERWRRIVREAARQCQARLVTEVHPLRPLGRLLRQPGADRKIYLSEHGGRPLKRILAGKPPASALLLVGPKGGWTEGEERKIREAGFEPASLGRRILRAETAAVAGAAMIAHFWTD